VGSVVGCREGLDVGRTDDGPGEGDAVGRADGAGLEGAELGGEDDGHGEGRRDGNGEGRRDGNGERDGNIVGSAVGVCDFSASQVTPASLK